MTPRRYLHEAASEIQKQGFFLHARTSELVICVDDKCGVVFRVGPEACPACASTVFVNLGQMLEKQERALQDAKDVSEFAQELVRERDEILSELQPNWRSLTMKHDAHLGAVDSE